MLKKNLFKLILIFMLVGTAWADDFPPDFEEASIPMWHEELRSINEDIDDTEGDISTNTTNITTNETDLDTIETYNLVVQVVNSQEGAVDTGTTFIPNDDTIPQIDEGDEYLTLAITPTAATNKLKIDVVVFGSMGANNNVIVAALFNTDTHATNALACGAQKIYTQALGGVQFTHYMTAPGTGTYTFRVRAGGLEAGTFTFNGLASAVKYGNVLASSITITEYKQ